MQVDNVKWVLWFFSKYDWRLNLEKKDDEGFLMDFGFENQKINIINN